MIIIDIWLLNSFDTKFINQESKTNYVAPLNKYDI